MKKKRIIWTVVLIIMTVGITVGVNKVINLGVFGNEEETGVIVGINSIFNGEVVLNVDTNGDGVPDIKVYTNSFLASDIIKKTASWTNGKSDGVFTQILPFTPIKVKAWRCIMVNGTVWERIIPKYILADYGDNLTKKTAQK